MKLSGVLLVHNDERYLPYSLGSLLAAPLDELVIVLDRCADKSEKIVRTFKPKYSAKILIKDWNEWKNPIAETANFGFSQANGDIVYALQADVYHDILMFDKDFYECFDMVNYRVESWDLDTPLIKTTYEKMLDTAYRMIRTETDVWESGVFGTKKSVWEKFKFKDSVSCYGEHTQFMDYKTEIEKAGYSYYYNLGTRNLHLKEKIFTKSAQLGQGKGRAILGYPYYRVMLHSFLHMKPHVFVGYVKEKRRKNT